MSDRIESLHALLVEQGSTCFAVIYEGDKADDVVAVYMDKDAAHEHVDPDAAERYEVYQTLLAGASDSGTVHSVIRDNTGEDRSELEGIYADAARAQQVADALVADGYEGVRVEPVRVYS